MQLTYFRDVRKRFGTRTTIASRTTMVPGNIIVINYCHILSHVSKIIFLMIYAIMCC